MVDDDDDPAGGGINPGPLNSSPQSLADLNGVPLFQADDGVNGAELWRSDGTAAGTSMVDDDDPADCGINAGAAASAPAYLTRMGGAVFFAAPNFDAADALRNTELWRADGTSAGTSMVAEVNPSPPSWGSEPYGTAAGTTVLEDSVPGGGINPGDANSSPHQLTNLGGTVFLAANDGGHGDELWRTLVEAPPAPPVTTTTPNAGPTGQRAAALKKCRKVKKKKTRKRCRKRAKRLPL